MLSGKMFVYRQQIVSRNPTFQDNLTSMEADPGKVLHLSEAFSDILQPGELFPLSRVDVSTVCCLRMLVNLVNRSPMEACLNHGKEIFRRLEPDFGALGGKAPDSGLVTDILSITSQPSRGGGLKKISLHHLFSHFSSLRLAMTSCRRMSLANLSCKGWKRNRQRLCP